jgi:hypothetical protein
MGFFAAQVQPGDEAAGAPSSPQPAHKCAKDELPDDVAVASIDGDATPVLGDASARIDGNTTTVADAGCADIAAAGIDDVATTMAQLPTPRSGRLE